jgi:Flp pilus assembly protein TadG
MRLNGRTVERIREQRGAAAVEFVLIMTLLLIIVFGIVEFGIAYSKVNVYTGAAREGARYAAVRCYPDSPCDGTDIETRVTNAAVGYAVGPGTPSADITCDGTNVGAEVTVSWEQDIEVNIPFLPGLNPITYTRTMQGVFRCE